MLIFYAVLAALLGYGIGSINLAYLTARLMGFDIREKGSGNAGASNVVITIGYMAGLLVALFDIGKAWAAVNLAHHWFPELTLAAEIAGCFTILGHMFPILMGFRGGKGLACLGGVVLAFDAGVFFIMLLCECALALMTDYICVVPLSASAAFPLVYYFIVGQLAGAFLYALMIPVFFMKHIENLKRIQAGTEARISYLWSKDQAVLQMKQAHRFHK